MGSLIEMTAFLRRLHSNPLVFSLFFFCSSPQRSVWMLSAWQPSAESLNTGLTIRGFWCPGLGNSAGRQGLFPYIPAWLFPKSPPLGMLPQYISRAAVQHWVMRGQSIPQCPQIGLISPNPYGSSRDAEENRNQEPHWVIQSQ